MGLTIYTGPVHSGKAKNVIDKCHAKAKLLNNVGINPQCFLFKPDIDRRFGTYIHIDERGGELRPANSIEDSHHLLSYLVPTIKYEGTSEKLEQLSEAKPEEYERILVGSLKEPERKIIGVIEAHLLDDRTIDVFEALTKAGVNVVASCLNFDFARRPFAFRNISNLREYSTRTVEDLVKMAERIGGKIENLTAYCSIWECHNEAIYSQRLVNGIPDTEDSDLVEIPTSKKGHHQRNISYEARCLEHHVI